MQQVGAAFNLAVLVLGVLEATVVPSSQTNPGGGLDWAQLAITFAEWALGLIGIGLQVFGRFVSARTPVRAPRVPGWGSVVAAVTELAGWWVLGALYALFLYEEDRGNRGSGLPILIFFLAVGWVGVTVVGELVHGFAVGSVGRVLKAGGVKVFGRILGLFAMTIVLFAILSFCGFVTFAVWQAGSGPPGGARASDKWMGRAWVYGLVIQLGLYLVLDMVLLQAARAAIARIASGNLRDDPAEHWG